MGSVTRESVIKKIEELSDCILRYRNELVSILPAMNSREECDKYVKDNHLNYRSVHEDNINFGEYSKISKDYRMGVHLVFQGEFDRGTVFGHVRSKFPPGYTKLFSAHIVGSTIDYIHVFHDCRLYTHEEQRRGNPPYETDDWGPCKNNEGFEIHAEHQKHIDKEKR